MSMNFCSKDKFLICYWNWRLFKNVVFNDEIGIFTYDSFCHCMLCSEYWAKIWLEVAIYPEETNDEIEGYISELY